MEIEQKLSKDIQNICSCAGIPYIDVLCSKEDKQVFRYTSGDNVTGKERLQMYSCSKPITALAAMILVEKGKLSLDDEVEKYLPEIEEAFLLSDSGEKISPKNKMKVRHLLTMTAGFTYDLKTRSVRQIIENNRKAKLRDFIKAFVASPLSFEPGERFQYSLCHDVLAAVIEVVSGLRFSAFIQKYIFDPLGMKYSFFDNRRQDFLQMYEANEDGKIFLTDHKNPLIPTVEYESGGAGLTSTVEDYAKFARMLANDGVAASGKRIISSDFLKIMTNEQIEKMSIKNHFACIQGDDYGYGFGLRVRKVSTGWGLPKGEFGWDGAAGSYLMVDPINKISIVIGMNVMNWPYVFQNKHLEIVRLIYENCFRNGDGKE